MVSPPPRARRARDPRCRADPVWHARCSSGRHVTGVLILGSDRSTTQALAIACRAHGANVMAAENVPAGVRRLLAAPVGLIIVEHGLLRLSAAEHLAMFERVAPGVPVAVIVPSDGSTAMRDAYDAAGFRVVTGAAGLEALLAEVVA
jgi:DNA-binding response OmpR family regulator